MKPNPEGKETESQEETYEKPGNLIDLEPQLPQANPGHNDSQNCTIQVQESLLRRLLNHFTNWLKELLRPPNLLTCALAVFAFFQLLDQDKQVGKITNAINSGISKASSTAQTILDNNSKQMEAVLEENRIALKSALETVSNDAKKSVEATIRQGRDALNVSIDALHLEQRPWLDLVRSSTTEDDERVTGIPKEWLFNGRVRPGQLVLRIVFVNLGRSPARNIHVYRIVSVFTPTVPQASPSAYLAQITTRANTLFEEAKGKPGSIEPTMPQRTPFIETDTALDPSDAFNLNVGGRSVLIFTGYVTYQDIFQPATDNPHETEFCYWMTGNRTNFRELTGCGAHNDIR